MTAHSQVDNTPSLTESFLAPVTFPGHMIHLLYVTLDIKINKQAAGLQGKDVGRYMYTACHETKTMLDMSQGPDHMSDGWSVHGRFVDWWRWRAICHTTSSMRWVIYHTTSSMSGSYII